MKKNSLHFKILFKSEPNTTERHMAILHLFEIRMDV